MQDASALTLYPDLILRLPEMLRSSASLLESQIAEMSSTYLSGEEWMIIQLLFLLILRWILLLSVISLSLTLRFSLVLYMRLSAPPSFFQTDTHTQNRTEKKQQVWRVLTAKWRLPAKPDDLMKEKETWKYENKY